MGCKGTGIIVSLAWIAFSAGGAFAEVAPGHAAQNLSHVFYKYSADNGGENTGVSIRSTGSGTPLISNRDNVPGIAAGRPYADSSSGVVEGFGAWLHVNNAGTVATKIGIDDPPSAVEGYCQDPYDCRRDDAAAVVTTSGGGMTVIAMTGDNAGTAGHEFCSFWPGMDINNSGQVGFIAEVKKGDVLRGDYPRCGETGSFYKGAFRGSGGSVERMLVHGDMVNAGGNYPVSGGPSSAQINDSGQMLVNVELDDDDDFVAMVLLNSPADRTVIDYTGTGAGRFQSLEKGVLNNQGQVLYKGEFENGSETGAQLVIYNGPSVFTSIIAQTGQAPGPGVAQFQGFSPLYDMNDQGQAAFVAGLQINGQENDGDRRFGDYQAVYYWDGGSLREIARTTAAADADSGSGYVSGVTGFNFRNFWANVAVSECGSVLFCAENIDPPIFGGDNNDENTACFVWSTDNRITELVREGDELAQGTVYRIHNSSDNLKDMFNEQGRAALVMSFDSTDDADTEIVLFQAICGELDRPIPTLGFWGVFAAALALLGSGFLYLRRRRSS